MIQLDSIDTEQINPRTIHIDQEDSLGIVSAINREDRQVAIAVEKELEHIAQAVDRIHERLLDGGRLIYCGAGTSGRLGVLDAAECPPTFGVSYELVQGVIAGGTIALVHAVEGMEDNEDQGRIDLEAIRLGAKDALVGIAASGRTPYVLGALDYARSLGAYTIGLTSCQNSELKKHADLCIEPMTGPEVITGSTRMKSGTAQKMVLNMLSTASMIKLGKVYGNLMVDVQATNEKLIERAVSIVQTATGVESGRARQMLVESNFSCKHAIVMILLSTDLEGAKAALEKTRGHISHAVASRAAR